MNQAIRLQFLLWVSGVNTAPFARHMQTFAHVPPSQTRLVYTPTMQFLTITNGVCNHRQTQWRKYQNLDAANKKTRRDSQDEQMFANRKQNVGKLWQTLIHEIWKIFVFSADAHFTRRLYFLPTNTMSDQPFSQRMCYFRYGSSGLHLCQSSNCHHSYLSLQNNRPMSSTACDDR